MYHLHIAGRLIVLSGIFVNMGYIKTKPQPQGLYNYKFGYKIDQIGLISAAGTAPQVKCLEYKNQAD